MVEVTEHGVLRMTVSLTTKEQSSSNGVFGCSRTEKYCGSVLVTEVQHVVETMQCFSDLMDKKCND